MNDHTDNYYRLAEAAESVRRYFFPRQIDVPDHVRDVLEQVYPTVDWERVDFYGSWPHVLGHGDFRAITLPDPHSLHRTNIYFKPEAWQPDSRRGLSTIIHEGYHVLQMQEMYDGYGLGLVRPFLASYLACWARNGFAYSGHPMETAAYGVAGKRTARFERHLDALPGRDETRAVVSLSFRETGTGRSFWQHMQVYDTDRVSEKGPGGEILRPAAVGLSSIASVLWIACWSGISLLLWGLWLLLEGVGLIASGGLRILSRIQRGAEGSASRTGRSPTEN